VNRAQETTRLFRAAGALLLLAGVAQAQFSLAPAPPPGPPVPLPNGIATIVYSTTISAVSNMGAVTWNSPAGLPPGLALTPIVGGPAAATIGGTPTTPGTFVFTVQGTDALLRVATQQYSITIAPPLTIVSPATVTGGTVGFGYSYTFSAANGTPPYTWAAGMPGVARRKIAPAVVLPPGTLPAGLGISAGGVLSGVPSTPGTYTFDIEVTDSAVPPQVTFSAFTMTVDTPPVVSSPSVLTAGTTGVVYGVPLTVTGGTAPFVWQFVGGALPPGLLLGSAGSISGIPTKTGTYNFNTLVRDNWGASSVATFTLLITQGLTITTPSPLPGGVVHTFYQQPLAAAAGTPSYTWALTGGVLPTGIFLNPATGLLSGTPTVAGTFRFTIQVTDSAKAAIESNFSLTIALPLSITTASLPSGTVGTAYSQSVLATGGTPPYTWSFTGALPPGLSLNTATGAITGTPTTTGISSFTVTVTDAAKLSASQAYRVSIASAVPLAFTTPSPLPGATGGAAYTQPIGASGGTQPYTFAVTAGSLPAGLAFSSGGTLSGTPTSIGTFPFSVTVTDANSSTATQAYQLTVAAPALPAPAISGVSGTEPPAEQPTLSLQLASGYPLPLTGNITLTFASAQGNVDDPAIQFSTVGRTVPFTVPAGSTSAVFPANLSIDTGTVAGTITLALSFQAGGQDVTPSPAPTRTITIAAAAPVITAVTAQRTSSGIEVDVTGYSTPRSMTGATFQFQSAPGTNLQGSQVMLTVDQLFTTWYTGSGSAQYGSRFTFAQQFTISGSSAGITGVAVTLANAQGTSNSVSATLP
jgi:hypothetical protein